MKLKQFAAAATFVLSAALFTAPTQAQTVEEFYKGNTVTLMVSAAPGGGADLYARAFAPFMSKHLPGNPNVVVTNVPGAGGLTAAAQLQNSAPSDGTVIAALQRNNLYLPLVSPEKLAFDPREVNWIGSLNKESYVLITWENAPVKTLDDLFVRPLTIGSTSFNNENRTFPAMINEYLGGKMEIIPGYKGNDEIALAMERGEVQGRAVTTTSLLGGNDANWLAEGKLNVVAQLAMRPNAAVKDVPMILDRVTDPKARSVFEFMFLPLDAGRPFAAPPGVPEDRLTALRAAFEAAAKDPGFIAEVAKQNATVEMIPGLEIHEILEKLYATQPEVLDLVKGLLVSG
ncbi:Bug family tripartite tricarboxylate transporter substrate binding protein [Sinorhizobium fredii]|uniref:Bug family tripartite tricarboxylate transporter substrate binding protein n=1 Tax=Rhizobium fredii TaxID=380 RepID=UPI003513CB68